MAKARGVAVAPSATRFSPSSPKDQIHEVFFGGRGKGKGKRSSAKGKGRRTNPRGYDGQIMTCDICGSESHFRAQCPQNSGGARPSGSGGAPAFGGYQADAGPLAGVSGVAFMVTEAPSPAASGTAAAPTPAASAASTLPVSAAPTGSWQMPPTPAEPQAYSPWHSVTTVSSRAYTENP